MDPEHYRFQLGSYECVSLYDGFHDHELEQMFANIPRADVEIALQAQDLYQKAVTTPFTFLYVNTGKNRILVDIGAGDLLPTTASCCKRCTTRESHLRVLTHSSSPTPTLIMWVARLMIGANLSFHIQPTISAERNGISGFQTKRRFIPEDG
jgi:hypothetical protein